MRNVAAKIKRATAYPQAPAYDVFVNVNRVARGWTGYYRYAHNNNTVGGKLSLVIYWRMVHYLGQKHRQSIAKVMRTHYGHDPQTGCKALYVYKPGQPPSPQARYFLWHKTPRRLTFAAAGLGQVEDRQAYIDTGWAKGRSQHQRLATRIQGCLTCAACGATGVTLFVHHPNRLGKAKRVKKRAGHVAASGMAQQTILLCRPCHLAYHHGNTHQ